MLIVLFYLYVDEPLKLIDLLCCLYLRYLIYLLYVCIVGLLIYCCSLLSCLLFSPWIWFFILTDCFWVVFGLLLVVTCC